MSRSGYSDDYGSWSLIRYRGAVKSALNGKRGQAFLREMLVALDFFANGELIKNDLEKEGAVCALGAIGKARGIDMSKLDPEDAESVAHTFGIAEAMAREIVFENDNHDAYWAKETPEQRFECVRSWVLSKIKPAYEK